MGNDLRDRAGELIRAQLADAAFDLVVQHGYDNVTTAQLAEGLGISRASLFRYLGSKEEVVVAGTLGAADLFSNECMRVVTGVQGVDRWSDLRRVVEPAVEMAEASGERMRSRLRIILQTPALGSQLRRARSPQIENLTSSLKAKGYQAFEASILATTTIAVLDQCWSTWARSDSADFRQIVDDAFTVLANA